MAEPVLACLMPAAGGSERLGRAKQLIDFEGQTLVSRAAKLLLGRSARVVVVTGAYAFEVGDVLRGLPVTLVHNAAWRSGMGGSIAAGMHALGDGPDGVLIMLCDQWRVGGHDLDQLVDAWRTRPSAVATASFDGACGPPAIFPRRLFADLRGLQGKAGAKGLIRREAAVLPVEIPGARHDLDTLEDLHGLRAKNR